MCTPHTPRVLTLVRDRVVCERERERGVLYCAELLNYMPRSSLTLLGLAASAANAHAFSPHSLLRLKWINVKHFERFILAWGHLLRRVSARVSC